MTTAHLWNRARPVDLGVRQPSHQPWNGLPCYWCGGLRLADGWDHLVPTSRGGTDDPANLVPACNHCNATKAGKTPAEFGAWLRERARIGATTCPRCGAGPGESCRNMVRLDPSYLHASVHPERKSA